MFFLKKPSLVFKCRMSNMLSAVVMWCISMYESFYIEKSKNLAILMYKLCLKYQNLQVITEKIFITKIIIYFLLKKLHTLLFL